jgi:hypothetical protein
MIKDTIKINLTKNGSFAAREKEINVQTQKQIDLYNSRGFIVVNHSVLNKSDSHATVTFSLKKMLGSV